MALHRVSAQRAAAFLTSALILAKTVSIGLMSGEQAGRNRSAALLFQSQIDSMTALRGLLSEAASLGAMDRHLSESLKQAKAAEERRRRR